MIFAESPERTNKVLAAYRQRAASKSLTPQDAYGYCLFKAVRDLKDLLVREGFDYSTIEYTPQSLTALQEFVEKHFEVITKQIFVGYQPGSPKRGVPYRYFTLRNRAREYLWKAFYTMRKQIFVPAGCRYVSRVSTNVTSGSYVRQTFKLDVPVLSTPCKMLGMGCRTIFTDKEAILSLAISFAVSDYIFREHAAKVARTHRGLCEPRELSDLSTLFPPRIFK